MALIRVNIKETLLRTMILFLAGAQMGLNSTSPNINSVYTPHPLFYSRNQYVSLSNTGKTICRQTQKTGRASTATMYYIVTNAICKSFHGKI